MKTIEKIEDLLKVPVVWRQHSDKPQWSATVLNELCELRMNNFPDEPLYTVKWRGQTLEIEDAPANWTIPLG